MKYLGTILIILGLTILALTFGPVLKVETIYQFNQVSGKKYSSDILPKDKDFGIVIPKINVNEKIFPQIDSTNPSIYLPVLKKGVAQALGSANPGTKSGNVFLFAHSTDAFYNVLKYNASFYLIGKLKVGDEVDIYYKETLYKYLVYAKAVIGPDQLDKYVKSQVSGKTITLQTCYPPGTTLKRLVVFAKIIE